ncbi:MAG: cysteine hydrolase [Deltaproteobacteria bacterium]|nr:cysteine hydrolase [Deltaproteobacteria bacterium]
MNKLPQKTALLLIDVQEGFNAPLWGMRDTPQAEENIAGLLAKFRAQSQPIYHVQHLSRNPKSPLAPGQPGVDFMAAARPRHGERIFQKHVNSAFIGTNLEEVLRKDGIQRLVIGGIAVDHCVSTTTRMAANLGFDVLLVADATIAHDRKGHDGAAFPAQLVHAITLASLHGEFATVLTTVSVLDIAFQ